MFTELCEKRYNHPLSRPIETIVPTWDSPEMPDHSFFDYYYSSKKRSNVWLNTLGIVSIIIKYLPMMGERILSHEVLSWTAGAVNSRYADSRVDLSKNVTHESFFFPVVFDSRSDFWIPTWETFLHATNEMSWIYVTELSWGDHFTESGVCMNDFPSHSTHCHGFVWLHLYSSLRQMLKTCGFALTSQWEVNIRGTSLEGNQLLTQQRVLDSASSPTNLLHLDSFKTVVKHSVISMAVQDIPDVLGLLPRPKPLKAGKVAGFIIGYWAFTKGLSSWVGSKHPGIP